MMRLESLTNSELIRELRDDFSMSEREMVILDRLMSATDEIDRLTGEVMRLLPKPPEPSHGDARS